MWLLALLIPLSGMGFHLCQYGVVCWGQHGVVCWGQHVWCVGVSTCGVLESAVFPSDCSIYAIGDCIHGPMLAHKAEDEGEWPM